MIKHIGLQVSEKDIEFFYITLFNGEISGSFVLERDLAMAIFNINKSVKVFHLKCEDIEFELFVNDNTSVETFHHVCLLRENAEEIYKKAVSGGYRTYVHRRGDSKTYFIKDKMNNTFELKMID
jgi:hypothetical protein